MTHIKVNLSENSYEILVGHNSLPELGGRLKTLPLGKDAVVITNPLIRKLHGKTLSAALKQGGFSVKVFEVPDGEGSKSAQQAFDLIEKLSGYNIRRNIFVIAFGGGVVGDLSGYVAAAYRRGIPYVQVPTSLLAQIDSAIGGKVAIDLPSGKNLVGAFYQPRMVYTDTALLSTLDERQIRNGLAEVIKYGVICDRKFFEYVQQNVLRIVARDPKVLTEIIVNCSRIKARIVAQDEKEVRGMRTILNFGHTVGHAIETANQYKDYQHGEAVALGMRVAGELSVMLGLVPEASVQRMNDVITAVGLPERILSVPLANILKFMAHDKKFSGNKNRFVLLTGIGSVKVVEGIDPVLVETAVKKYL